MEIKVGKKGIIWGYLAQIISMGSGIIVLPFILKMLSPSEVGLNYLLLTIGSLVTLLDFGFAGQFGRNVTYAFMGVRELRKEGIAESTNSINYKLLAALIKSSQYLYRNLSFFALLILLSIGTYYVYNITDKFTNVSNSLIIWLLYCVSIFFNLYFLYYNSLLNGSGKIIEYRKAIVFSKITYTVICILLLLLLNGGLISVVIANFIAPFVFRIICQKAFFTKELREKIEIYSISKKDIQHTIKIIWYNSKKLGLVTLGSFIISKSSFFIAGIYLSLEDVASYGLMVQIFSFIAAFSLTIHYLYHSKITSLWIKKDKAIVSNFSITVVVFFILYITGALIFCLFGDFALTLLKSNTHLPGLSILIIYAIITLLESNQTIFTAFISINNKIPFLKSTLISGILIILFTTISLKYISLGILGLVIVQGIIQLSYNYWKWTLVGLKMLRSSYCSILKIGFCSIINQIRTKNV